MTPRTYELALYRLQLALAWVLFLGSAFQFAHAMWIGADAFAVFCMMCVAILADKMRKFAAAELREARKKTRDHAD